jgi:predicted hotdog family 3-hydroxylacyl-ACP dehydratase
LTAVAGVAELLSCRIQPKHDGSLRFICENQATTTTVIKGPLSTVACTSVAGLVAASADLNSESGIASITLDAQAIYQKLPYGNNFRFIETLRIIDDQQFEAICYPIATNPFYQQGVSSWFGLEFAAQALAGFGVANLGGKTMRQCCIVAIKKMRVMTKLILVSQHALTVSGRLLAQQDNAASCEFVLRQGEQVLCSGQFSVMFS